MATLIEFFLLLPFLILGFVTANSLLFRRNLTLQYFTFVLSLVPALTPGISLLGNYSSYTLLNLHLQREDSIVTHAILIICVFSLMILVPGKALFIRVLPNKLASITFGRQVSYLMAGSCVLVALFLFERGTIFFSDYKSLFEAKSKYSSLYNQIFNIFAVFAISHFIKFKDAKRLRLFFLIIIFASLLVSRRTTSLGFIFLYFCLNSFGRLSMRNILILTVGGFGLWFVGEARNVGLLNYFNSDSLNERLLYYSMPGGGANIFVSLLGVIDYLSAGVESVDFHVPMLQWFRGVIENDIYSDLGYDYNGGMHIAAIFYWNFGIIGVVFGGLFLGLIVTNISRVFGSENGKFRLDLQISIAFVILLPNILWYHPIGFIKICVALYFFAFFARILPLRPLVRS